MSKKHGSISPNLKHIFLLSLLTLVAPLFGQHGAHTHGKAELNLVLNSDRELIAELIAPAESVYGFEHAPRNAKETEQMNEGLKRLKASIAKILTFEKKISCNIAEFHEEGYAGSETRSQYDDEGSQETHHGHEAHRKHPGKSHNHHGEKHQDHEDHHRNVVIRWSVRCGTDLKGQNVMVNWSEALLEIHRINVTLLASDRQDAISLRRSGTKVRL